MSKLIIVGEGGVGKTSLLKSLRGESFNYYESTTHGIEVQTLEFAHPAKADVTMQLNAWDFGGQDIDRATHQFFLTNRSLFLLAWNARLGYEQGKLYYWLDTIQSLAPDSPILLVATHIDKRDANLPFAELLRISRPAIQSVKKRPRRSIAVERFWQMANFLRRNASPLQFARSPFFHKAGAIASTYPKAQS